MRHSRLSSILLLQAEVAKMKEEGWPASSWRTILSKRVASVPNSRRAVGSVNGLISMLTAKEWDLLELPVPAARERPKSAIPTESVVVFGDEPVSLARRWEQERARRKEELMPVLVAEALKLHGAGEWVNFRKLATALHGKYGGGRSFQTFYEFLRRSFKGRDDKIALKILDEEGNPILPKEQSQTNLGTGLLPTGSGGEVNGKESGDDGDAPNISTQLLLREVDRVYEQALRGLPQERRTRAELAVAMKKPPDVVDSYIYQRRAFAKQLIDGHAVFRKKFL